MSKPQKKYLVTGGAGYVGSVVAQHLLEAGHAVTVLDDLSTGFREGVPAGAEFIEGRVQDAAKWLDASYDGVLHFAAYSQVGESVADPEKYWVNNVGGSVALLAAMRDSRRTDPGLLLHRRDLRRARHHPHHRVRRHRAHQPLRRHETRR